MKGYTLAYDADCGPCIRFRRVVGFLDAGRTISFVSLALADRTGVLDGIPPRLRRRSFHLVIPGGEILSGAEAIPALTRILPAGRVTSRAMVAIPGGTRAAGFVYGVFSRMHDSGECKQGSEAFRLDSGVSPAMERSSAGMAPSLQAANYAYD